MRYAQGGGIDARGRARREQVRLEAASLIEAGQDDRQIATQLRVSVMSAARWRRAFEDGGTHALRSKGPSGQRPHLDPAQITLLCAALDQGPAEYGYREDQRWTLARIRDLITEMFGVRYKDLANVARLLHRAHYTWQVPTRRAVERDEDAITAWREETWPDIKGSPRSKAPGSASRTRPARD